MVVALLLSIMPLSTNMNWLRPEFVCLVVIYWVLLMPQQVGIGIAWIMGFTLDLIEGLVWGGHALAMTVLAYVCLLSYQRIRNYSVWHQSLWVFVLIGLHQVIVNWVQGLAGYQQPVRLIILPAVVSSLLWPVLFAVMQRLQIAYRSF